MASGADGGPTRGELIGVGARGRYDERSRGPQIIGVAVTKGLALSAVCPTRKGTKEDGCIIVCRISSPLARSDRRYCSPFILGEGPLSGAVRRGAHTCWVVSRETRTRQETMPRNPCRHTDSELPRPSTDLPSGRPGHSRTCSRLTRKGDLVAPFRSHCQGVSRALKSWSVKSPSGQRPTEAPLRSEGMQ